ncbi:MAG: cation-transporting P-type ATPase [Betaproteobacteria bacterium]
MRVAAAESAASSGSCAEPSAGSFLVFLPGVLGSAEHLDGIDRCTIGLHQATGPTTLDDATSSSIGLTSDEAQRRLTPLGANTLPDTAARPWRTALDKFWAPVPWMLDTTLRSIV